MNGRTITADQMKALARALSGPIRPDVPVTVAVSAHRSAVTLYCNGLTVFHADRATLLLLARERGMA